MSGCMELRPRLHVRRTDGRAFLVVAAPPGALPAAAATDAYTQIGQTLRSCGMEIVQERIFGSLSAEGAVNAARAEALRLGGISPDGPLTYIQGRPVWGEGLSGVIIHAVVCDRITTLRENGVARGRSWTTRTARYTILQNLHGSRGEDAPAQARSTIQYADSLLRQCGQRYRDTVRTWFYLADILAWYDQFNLARNEMYARFGLMPSAGERPLFPASTGIRADAPGGSACTLDLLAVSAAGGDSSPASSGATGGDAPSDDRRPTVRFLRNPRQQEAYRYGSSFARGAVISSPGEALVQISGTAAIDETGRSVHPGDTRAQIRCTFERVEALLAQVGAALKDISAATLFLKHAHDADILREELTELGLEDFPAVSVVADVCRDDLLFEIDAELTLPAET